MNIFHVSSEVFPYSKTGGLADMTAALAKAQRFRLAKRKKPPPFGRITPPKT